MPVNRRAVSTPIRTHEGAPAVRINAENELTRSVLSCLLWEDSFYESGEDIAQRISSLVAEVKPEFAQSLALRARSEFNLRHAPLWMLVALARLGRLSANSLAATIQRADELAEFLAMYWKDGRQPLSAQVKKGLAQAFTKFSAFELARYNRDNAIKLRDVLFMVHAKPKDDEQASTWRQLVDGTLPAPDTWEVNLSAGADKKETWERLLMEERLGYLALLRNLRNMKQVAVDEQMIGAALIKGAGRSRVLPFRFIAAARAVPEWEPMIEPAMLAAIEGGAKLPGKTTLLIDVSGSMDNPISAKSDLNRIDAACALAMLCREIGESIEVYSFSNGLAAVPPRRGFALRDAIVGSQAHQATYLGAAIEALNKKPTDRLIVFTDEQAHDRVPEPAFAQPYLINVASNQNGVGYGKWTHIDGFSEAIIQYIYESELQEAAV